MDTTPDENRSAENSAAERPALNRDDAENFLAALDPAATSFTFQCFDDDAERKAENVAKHNAAKAANARHVPPMDPFAAHPHGSLNERWSWLARMNAKRVGAFVTINATDGRGREKKNVKRVRAVFIDLDGKPLPDSFHAAPHIIVESSPGKWHAYWRVKDCALDKFKALQKRLAQHYGSDESVNDLPRVMRLPGFLHQKGEPFRTRLVEARGHPTYAVDDIARGLPELKAKPKDDGGGDGSEESADWGELYAGVVTGKSLYPALRDLALKYVFAGMTPGAIVNTLRALMDQSAARETDAARWKDRHGRIPEIVDGAIEKHAELMVPEANLRWRGVAKDGTPTRNMHNAMVAIERVGVACAHDVFHGKILIGYGGEAVELQRVVGEVTDGAVIALRKILGDHFDTDFGTQNVRDAVVCLAGQHQFDPVRDMLDQAQAAWDGVARLDTMVSEYANCADTPLNRAIMRKTMIAAVRRARRPGCKFDSITVLESEEGWNKSTFWRVLAGDENFSDESILGKSGKEIQEHLSAIWIHESADLAGMRKAEVESVKAFASRQVDIARPAYGYFVKKQPRHAINVGTTNSSEYLQSQTGNRRFWPLKVLKPIDIEKLERDRLQLWGEAAKREADGESINLPQELWGKAADEQEKRRVKDPWEEILASIPKIVEEETGKYETAKTHKIIYRLGDKEFVAAADVLTLVLKIPTDRQDRHHSMRLADAMKHLGWERERAVVDGVQRRGFARVHLPTLPTNPELRLARKN